MRAIDIFESHAKKKISILHWGQPWMWNGTYMPFQTAQYDKLRQRGIIPLISWWSWDLCCGTNQANFQNRDVYNGTYDAYIHQWARDAKAWGHPFFLRLDAEMNGWWFPWGEGITSAGTLPNGNQPGDYMKAYRHVHDVFTKVGATNATWVWCPNRVMNWLYDLSHHAPLTQVYPGDAYVDWICLDGYNWGSDGGSGWQTFDQIFTYSYNDIQTVAPNKPLMLGEVASSEDGGPLGRPYSKGPWITDMFTTQLQTKYDKVKAVVWYDTNDGNTKLDWPIESSLNSQNAFAAAIQSPYYATNQFANITTSPIPVLK
jgi:hypothetical protein